MINLIAAIGTWAAVLVVVYLESLKPLINAPRLMIRVAAVSTHQITTYATPSGLVESWQRLEVVNIGRSFALNVEVSIIDCTYNPQSLLVEAPTRSPAEFSSYLAGRSFKWSNVNSSTANIAPGTARLLDIVRLYSPKGRPKGYPSGVTLAIFPESKVTYREHVPSAHAELALQIVADRVSPRTYHVTIDTDGQWDENQEPPQVNFSTNKMSERRQSKKKVLPPWGISHQ